MARTETAKPRENSRLSHIYTDPDTGGPYFVTHDAWFTRRKRFHVIHDASDAVMFRSRWVADILNWLADRGAEEYTAVCGDQRFVVKLRAILPQDGDHS